MSQGKPDESTGTRKNTDTSVLSYHYGSRNVIPPVTTSFVWLKLNRIGVSLCVVKITGFHQCTMIDSDISSDLLSRPNPIINKDYVRRKKTRLET